MPVMSAGNPNSSPRVKHRSETKSLRCEILKSCAGLINGASLRRGTQGIPARAQWSGRCAIVTAGRENGSNRGHSQILRVSCCLRRRTACSDRPSRSRDRITCGGRFSGAGRSTIDVGHFRIRADVCSLKHWQRPLIADRASTAVRVSNYYTERALTKPRHHDRRRSVSCTFDGTHDGRSVIHLSGSLVRQSVHHLLPDCSPVG